MGIRSFDYFRKLSIDSETSSIIGGLLTIIACVVDLNRMLLQLKIAAILAMNETKLYFEQSIDYQAVIDNEDKLSAINAHIDIKITAPCYLTSFDTYDSVGQHSFDPPTIQKIRLDQQGNVIPIRPGDGKINYANSQEELQDALQMINDGESCQYKGYFRISKIPGNFHIGFHAQQQLMHRVIEGNLQTFQKVKLDHVISDLHFGEYSDDKQKILKQYPKTIQNYFQDWNQITRKSEEAYKTDPSQIFRQESISPYILQIFNERSIISKRGGDGQNISQPKSLNEMDTIWFKYQFSPINMVYKFEEKSFYHLIVRLCAIIGGVFAVMGMVNQISQKIA